MVKFKRTLAMLVAVSMMGSVFVGCGAKDEDTKTDATQKATEAPTEEATEAPTEEATEVPTEEATDSEEDTNAGTEEDADTGDTTDFYGEYVYSGDVGEVVFKVSEDNTFEMTSTGEVNQVISGTYKFGITESISIISMKLYPSKVVTDGVTEEIEEVQEAGTAVIEDGKLTLTMESEDTVFTKK